MPKTWTIIVLMRLDFLSVSARLTQALPQVMVNLCQWQDVVAPIARTASKNSRLTLGLQLCVV
ncbi:MAG: hypothetical protein RL032_2067 [Pseudomonadota bacterium]